MAIDVNRPAVHAYPASPSGSSQPDVNSRLDQKLLDTSGGAIADFGRAQEELSIDIGEHGLHFEGKPYPVSIRPYVLSDSRAEEIAGLGEWLVSVLDIAAELYRSDPRTRELFPACECMARHTTALPDFRPLVRICRLDGIFDREGRYRLLETNTDCPGGVIQNGMAAQVWSRHANPLTDGMSLCDRGQPLVSDPHCFVRELLSTHHARAGQTPQRAMVVNYNGRYTNEVEWMVLGLQRLGVDAAMTDAARLRRDGNCLRDGDGERVDLTYNKYELRDLIGKPEVDGYLRAAAAGEVTFVNPLISQWILSDKAIFAILTDERFAADFTEQDRARIREHVLWTRLLVPGPTTGPEGQSVELLSFVAQNRERFVLKPTNATRGEGVVVGPETTELDWLECLSDACDIPSVVQEYVAAPRIETFHPETGPTSMGVGLDTYVFGGKCVGFQARASRDAIMKIGKRGILLPVVVCAEAGQ